MEITLANREMRGKEQCSFFGVLILGKLYAIGTLIGSVGAPLLFGFLIATGSRVKDVRGDGSGAALMMSGAVCENLIGGGSRRKKAKPLQSSSCSYQRAREIKNAS